MASSWEELTAREAAPSERPALEAWLRARPAACATATPPAAWPPGRTFVARGADGGMLAAARLGDPPPGDGLHREHVRTVHVAALDGAARAAALAARSCVVAAGPGCRLEAEVPASREPLLAACLEAGLEREGRWPGGWREAARSHEVDLVVLGRACGPGSSPPSAGAVPPKGPASVHGPAAPARLERRVSVPRAAFDRFLDALVPGRSYPAGTLLSEAELAETSRRSAHEADWLLALDGDGAVVGGALVEPDARPERAHVRRVHLDVLAAARGRGVATALLRRLRDEPRPGVTRLEADPRAGNAAACAALERAGFALEGVQRGAWRMRTAAARGGRPSRWDEDVRLYSAAAGGSAASS